MQTLTQTTGTFDQTNTFTVNAGKTFPRTCSLQRDYEKEGDGVYWAMQHSGCVKAAYTTADGQERDRLGAMVPLTQGDIVVIDGKQYKTRVLGDFSDCAIFDPV